MFKKLTASLSCFLLILSLLPVAPMAAGYWESSVTSVYGATEVLTQPTLVAGVNAKEIAVNGGFEILEAENDLYAWFYTNTSTPVDRRTTTNSHSGEYALQFGPGETIQHATSVSRLDSDQRKRVEISLWINSPTKDFLLTFKNTANYRDPEDMRGKYVDLDFRYQNAKDRTGFEVTPNQWTQMILKYELPLYTVGIDVRLSGCSTDILIDDVSILVEGAPEPEEVITQKPMVTGAAELVKNGNFSAGNAN